MGISTARVRQVPARIRLFQIVLLTIVSIISYGALVLPEIIHTTAVPLKPGDVSPSDFQAPKPLDYISEVRTEEMRSAAENAVTPVYAAPNPTIARRQIEQLRTALQYITLVREDENATPEQKAADIASLSDIKLKPATIASILDLPAARWETIQQEALSVLEQVMRRTIHEQDVDVAHPVGVGEEEVVVAQVGHRPLEPAAGVGRGSGVGERHLPRLGARL